MCRVWSPITICISRTVPASSISTLRDYRTHLIPRQNQSRFFTNLSYSLAMSPQRTPDVHDYPSVSLARFVEGMGGASFRTALCSLPNIDLRGTKVDGLVKPMSAAGVKNRPSVREYTRNSRTASCGMSHQIQARLRLSTRLGK